MEKTDLESTFLFWISRNCPYSVYIVVWKYQSTISLLFLLLLKKEEVLAKEKKMKVEESLPLSLTALSLFFFFLFTVFIIIQAVVHFSVWHSANTYHLASEQTYSYY